MILVVASNKDIASLNVRKQILANYPFNETEKKFQENKAYTCRLSKDKDVRLVTLNHESVYAQDLTMHFTELKLVAFISRHSSISGKPTLSVHTPGNLGEAVLGGSQKHVSVSPANAMRDVLKTMAKMRDEAHLEFEVSYESTHHGPSLNAPTLFAELGSSPAQWNDSEAAKVVAQATMDAISKFGSTSAEAVLGIGGPHYNSKFTKIALEKNVAFGHMIPKHAVPQIDSETLQQCIKKTLENVECAFLDWKGIRSEDKPRLLELLYEASIPIQKV